VGGAGTDFATDTVSLPLDGAGTLDVVVGVTASADMFDPGAPSIPAGGFDLFLLTLNGAQGNDTVLIGGTGDEFDASAAADTLGNLFVAGFTGSADFPTTPGAFRAAAPGLGGYAVRVTVGQDGALSLQYSTAVRGDPAGITLITDVAADGQGGAYVIGHTNDATYPTTPGVIQPVKSGGAGVLNAVISRLNPSGTDATASTFLGGALGSTQALGVYVDPGGRVYVTGTTLAADFPVTPGAQQTEIGGLNDAYLAEMDSLLGALLSSTFNGGRDADVGMAITGIPLPAEGSPSTSPEAAARRITRSPSAPCRGTQAVRTRS